MAKSKNHTNHNQNRKAHRNGIKKPKKCLHESTMGSILYMPKQVNLGLPSEYSICFGKSYLGYYKRLLNNEIKTVRLTSPPGGQMDAKFLKNQRFSKRHNLSTKKQLAVAAQRKSEREARAKK